MRRAASARPLVPLLGLLLVARVAAAQPADALVAGARVRLHLEHPPRRVVGTLVGRDTGTLVVRVAGREAPWTVARQDVQGLEVRVRQRAAGAAFGRGAMRGALVGVAIGAVATAAAAIDDRRHPCSDCFITATGAVGVLSVGLTAVTTLAGGAIGLARRDVWRPVPVR